MGDLFAVIIGIEAYQDKSLKPVLFAEADARAMSTALEGVGCRRENQVVLVNAEATKTAIESDLARVLLGLTEDDQCFVFFAGHGLSNGSTNFLLAHDTRLHDYENTSVRLQKVLGLIKTCPSKKSVMFLDACHSGVKVEETMRSPATGVDLSVDLRKDEQFCACFASCRVDQKSYSSTRHKHGIWTHHLLQVLRGEVLSALEGDLLPAQKLQAYLAAEVPRTVRQELAQPRPQTPRFFGSIEGAAVIADLSALLAKNREKSKASAHNLDGVKLVAFSTESISSLDKFSRQKRHFVPTSHSDTAASFVRGLVSDEASEHVEGIHSRIRKAMKTKIKDITIIDDDGDGITMIRLPAVDYTVSVGQDPDDPGLVRWTYELDIRDPNILDDAAFNTVFADRFDTVQLTLRRSPKIKKLASSLEDQGLEVDCPSDYSSCSFVPKRGLPTVSISGFCIDFNFPDCLPPRELLKGFRAAFEILAGYPDILPLLAARPIKVVEN